jgi:hypothetical protein
MRLLLLWSVLLFSTSQVFSQQTKAQNFIGASLDVGFGSSSQGRLLIESGDDGYLSNNYEVKIFDYQVNHTAIRLSSYAGRKVSKRIDLGFSFDISSSFFSRNYEYLEVSEIQPESTNTYEWYYRDYYKIYKFPLAPRYTQTYAKSGKHFNLLLAPLIRYNFITDRRIGLDLTLIYGISQELHYTKGYRIRPDANGDYEVYVNNFKSDLKTGRAGIGRASLGLSYNFKNDWRLRLRKDLLHFNSAGGQDFLPKHVNLLVLEYQF